MTFADDDDDDGDVYRLTATLANGETLLIVQDATRPMAERVAHFLSRRTAFHDLRIEPEVSGVANWELSAPISALPR